MKAEAELQNDVVVPPSPVQEVDAPVQSVLADVQACVDEAERKWKDALERGLLDGLRQIVGELTAAEETASAILATEPADRRELHESIRAYRSAIAEDVIGKSGRFLRSSPPEERAAIALRTLLDTLQQAVHAVPEQLEGNAQRPYEAAPGDGRGRRFRKALVRAGRKVSRGRASRPIPARKLAAYHLQVRLPRRFIRRHKACLLWLCQLLSDVEEVFSNWTHTVLEMEERLDDPSYYCPSDFPVEAAPPDEDEPTLADRIDEIRSVAADLRKGLGRLSARLDSEIPGDGGTDPAILFAHDLETAGTFMLDEDERDLPSDAYLPVAVMDSYLSPWIDWLMASRNRMRINWHLLNLRSVTSSQLESLAERAASQTVQPLADAMAKLTERLGALKKGLEESFKIGEGQSREAMAPALEDLGKEVDAFIADVTSRVGNYDGAVDFLRGFGDSESVAVARSFGQLPGKLSIRTSPATPIAIELGYAEYESVDLKSIAQRMLGLRYSDQVAKYSSKLRLAVTQCWIDVEQAAEVVRFGLSAARDELLDDEAAEKKGAALVDHARELAAEGFSRAMEMAASGVDTPKAAWSDFIHGVVGISLADWVMLHRQALGAEMSDEWTGYLDRLRRQMQEWGAAGKHLFASAVEKGEVVLRLGRRQAHSLIQRGQSAVGVSPAAKARRVEAIDAIATWTELVDRLPLVYRRLFSFDALMDSSLMVNRSTDLRAVENHFQRWQSGMSTNTLIVSSAPGAGRRSFMNVVERSIFSAADVNRIDFRTRYFTEAELVPVIAAALDLDWEGEPTFAALEAAVWETKTRTRPVVCIVSGLEHILLRKPGGSRLMESLLIFFSRTDEKIYWIGTMGNLMRYFLEKTLQISGIIDFESLTEFGKDATQSMLMSRHRKSGLPLTFVMGDDMGTIMKQRLRRAKTDEDRQALISNAFFERISKDSGQNLRLALFYWLRSIDFGGTNSEISVGSVKTLGLEFLNDLDLRSAFSLRAILFHLTLTVEEHNQIFRMTERQGTVIMESLLNNGLILPQDQKEPDRQARLRPGVRYRVNPLLVHPIAELLRGRHMIY